MSHRTINLTEELYDYLLDVSLREPAIMRRLRAETARLPMARMQSSPEAAQFLGLLVELIGAKKVIEVGVFTGYATLAMALALPANGKLIACDVSEEYTTIARRFWKRAGVARKIDLRLAPALDTLDALLKKGAAGTFDLAFIDADKENYAGYYERTLKLLRRGGLIVVDNVLWGGRVADRSDRSPSTRAIRAFNRRRKADKRATLSLIPVGDGLTLARKR